ncbi:flagellar export protein FliJ [Pseudogracilibacillus auburnensis]|uniref:Flagellar FliJ protein n=1 Tax=Pseudogracilibacillus auburnensis TaxID=1494959 RepID=A0A2V3W650_9BACI|nr:flagellar export protein FliJ [Pseudogracilibacillus auburnensis]MBO1003806.1 flagellar export protein FliJ [Pseudogracilibacillus auburnensis]PXW88608.1 flagellar FliJ protein [Pseudogracilibacillus auburnensis]
MSQTAVLHKILHVREQEKKDAQMEQISARNYFEEVATQLYSELKTKEQAEQTLDNYMQASSAITKIKEQSLYIHALNKKIMVLQQQVQQARKQMEDKQEILTEAHVEVKKIETMIGHREKEIIAHKEKLESMMMDEISIRQFNTQVQNR